MLIFDISNICYFLLLQVKLSRGEHSSPPLVSDIDLPKKYKEYSLTLINTSFNNIAAYVTLDTEYLGLTFIFGFINRISFIRENTTRRKINYSLRPLL